MKTSTKLALAFAALAGATATAANADEGMEDHHGGWHGHATMRFDRADADSSGDITLEEFTAAFGQRFDKADADGDGKMTVEEIADALERARFERRAKRIIDRFDVNGDGVLAADEVASRREKLFALLDRNSDGKLEKDEMRHHRFGRHGGRHNDFD